MLWLGVGVGVVVCVGIWGEDRMEGGGGCSYSVITHILLEFDACPSARSTDSVRVQNPAQDFPL